MTEFLELNELEVFWKKIKKYLKNKELKKEKINILDSIDRISGKKIKSKVNLPPFNRSTVDGFAVRAQDTAGASTTLPAYLDVIGEVKMGEKTNLEIGPGEAVEMPTGGMIPEGADAVLMIEYTDYLDKDTIETAKAVAVGENIVVKGEDIASGDLLFDKGHRIRPRDIGAMAGLGITELSVYKKPEIAVISTGDELIEPGEEAGPAQIRDINSYSITSLLKSYGVKAKKVGIIKDEFDLLKKAVKNNLNSDLVLISGGSSVGVKDMTIDLLNSLGEPGVLLHGLSIKPGKPTILAIIDETPVIGLPGHPASAWTVSRILLEPIIKFLIGEIDIDNLGRKSKKEGFEAVFKAELTRNIVSDKGREEYLPVKLINDEKKLKAEPIVGKSSLITTLVSGDGLIKINTFEEGKNKGDLVKVELIEPGIY
ncbi:MAG: gephyrin-like molybdotransferase Glp [Bacillota bacterium]